jgi:hypothetical protein
MRLALTALAPRGPKDIIISGDDDANAGQVAEALNEAFTPQEYLAPVIMHPRAAWERCPPAPGPPSHCGSTASPYGRKHRRCRRCATGL